MELSDYRKILIHGPSGSGKTTLLGHAQFDKRTSPMLLLDFDKGSSAVTGTGIKVVPINDWQDYNKVYAALSQWDPKEAKGLFKNGDVQQGLIDPSRPPRAGCYYEGIKYRSLGIDSVSETHVFSLLGAMSKRVWELQQGNKVDNVVRLDENRSEQADFGIALTQMRRFLRTYRTLPMHVFLTALTESRTEPGEGTVRRPALAGQMGDEIVSMVDVCAYLLNRESVNSTSGLPESQRILLLHSQPGIRAKARAPWGKTIPPALINPTISMLFDVLEVGLEEEPKQKA